MGESLRTFIAIKIIPDKNFLLLFENLRKKLEGESIKWVDVNNFHITLHFFGNTTQEQVETIKHQFESIGENFHPFEFSIKGLGYFKKKDEPKILFANIESSQALNRLAVGVEELIVKLGFEKDGRDFNPHLTLGRIKFLKKRNNFYQVMEKYKEMDIQNVYVPEIIFYKSILKPSGPVYKPISKIKLLKNILD